ISLFFLFFTEKDGIQDATVTGVQTCALPICSQSGLPLTELAQLANLATLVEGPIDYDTLSGKILNSKPASKLLHREYRKGWSLRSEERRVGKECRSQRWTANV